MTEARGLAARSTVPLARSRQDRMAFNSAQWGKGFLGFNPRRRKVGRRAEGPRNSYYLIGEVREQLSLKKNPLCSSFFEDILGTNKSLFNMRALIEQQLRDVNINNIQDIKEDTYSNVELFFSHRRSTHLQNLPTGRMINIIGFRK